MSRDSVYLRHILEALDKIQRYTVVGRKEFFEQPHWQDATIRQFEVVGEAVKRLSQDLKAQRPEIPWQDVAGMRDVLIHDYFAVDLKAVWSAAELDVPQLRRAIEYLLDRTVSE